MKKVIPLVDVNKVNAAKYGTLDKSHVAADHLWTFDNRKMNFNKDLGLKGKYCYHPFNTITVDSNGDVFMCICQAWLPVSVGKIWEFNSFEEISSSPKALEIQASIIDGSYRYCDHNTCSIIKEDELSGRIDHKPQTINWINFAVDNSCNLTCPSCRKEFEFLSEGPEYDKRIKIVNHLKNLIENNFQYIKFTLSGDGDPFASLIYRHFLSDLNLNLWVYVDPIISTSNINQIKDLDFTNLPVIKNEIQKPEWTSTTDAKLIDLRKKLYHISINENFLIEEPRPFNDNPQKTEIELVTNGLLLKDHWHKLNKIHKNIIRTKISFDAGTEPIYNITRRGGSWSKLLESATFLAKWKQKTYSNMVLTANFVVQTVNYRDMPAYVELCDCIGFDEINFQKITDWGTFTNFKEHAVWQEEHPEHKDFLKVLEHPSLNNKKINFTNLK